MLSSIESRDTARAPRSPRNLVLVSLDTLRADVAYSGRFPALARLDREATSFARVVAPAPFTPVSHATILTGLNPSGHGIRHLLRERLSPDAEPLASVLSTAGYRTGAIVSCPGLNRWYGFQRGFDTYDDEIPRLPDGRDAVLLVDVAERGFAAKRADTVVDRALAWVDGVDRSAPFFLFTHFFDAHWPYDPPAGHRDGARNPYEGEVAYMDAQLDRLLRGIENRGVRLDDTLLVVLSDHGEDLGGWYGDDHAGALGHPEERGHGALLYDNTLLVPLWIRAPGLVPAGRRIDAQARLCDVAPTILDLLQLRGPPADGASLRGLIEGREVGDRPAYSETHLREELGGQEPPLRPWKAARPDARWTVIWEHGGEAAWVIDRAADPNQHHRERVDRPRPCQPAVPAAPPAANPESRARVEAGLRAHPHLHAGWTRLESALGTHPQAGFGVKGSVRDGTVDALSDLDVCLLLPAGVTDAERTWAREALQSVGRVLAWFPADHIGLPDLLVSFLEVDGRLVKIDLELAGTTPDPGLLVRVPAQMGRPPRTTPPVPMPWGLEGIHHRFSGWVWYTWTKIARGELLEAHDSLAVMRGRAILPSLLLARGLKLEGHRRLEQRLSPQDLAGFRETIPATPDREELLSALHASANLFRSLHAELAASGPVDHRTARLDTILELIASEPRGRA